MREADPFGFLRIITASSFTSLAELGIFPLLMAGLIMYTLRGLKIIKINIDNYEERLLYNGTLKVLAILITIAGGIFLIISGNLGLGLDFGSQLFILLQVLLTGIIIIYLIL